MLSEVEWIQLLKSQKWPLTGDGLERGGKFYGGHIGQAVDYLQVAPVNQCDVIERQLEPVVDEKFNGGPRFGLNDAEAGLNQGFKGLQL
jgi:histidine ammonia-lyase